MKKSRGELFIEKTLSERKNNSSRISSRVKDKKEKKDDYMALSKRRGTAVVGCYGCGATLQTEEEEAPGYVPLDLYEMVCTCYRLGLVFFFRVCDSVFIYNPEPSFPKFSAIIQRMSTLIFS